MKRHGLSAFDNGRVTQYTELGQSLIRQKTNELSTQLQLFKSILLNFLDEHNDELTNDLNIRNEFIHVCQLVGIDPLKIYGKHNKMNEFYYELCCRIIERSNETKDINGGLIRMSTLLKELKELNVTRDDVERCITMMKLLNEDLCIVNMGHKEYLQNVHIAVTKDQNIVFGIVNDLGFVTRSLLVDNLGWMRYKCDKVLEEMVMSGYLWVDDYKGERKYWDPAWIDK